MPSAVPFLNGVTVADVNVKCKSLIACDENTPVDKAYDLLNEQKIIAMPVYKPEGDKKSYTGILTVFDLLHYVAFQPVFSSTKSDVTVSEQKEMLAHPVKQALGASKDSSHLWVFLTNEPLTRVIDTFKSGVHRGLVVQDSGEKLISQTDVVQYLFDNKSKWSDAIFAMTVKDVLKKQAESVEHQPKPVTIADSTHAITGFKKMYLHKVNAVAVLNDKGKVIGTLSASDLRGFPRKDLKSIEKPVMEFLTIVNNGKTPEPVVSVASTPLSAILERMLNFKVHRVWIVDEKETVIGVVSMSDVIGMFV